MSDCSCVYVDYDGIIEKLNEKIRKARKKHVCCECKKEIKKGEKYEDYVGVLDGKLFTYKTCLDCVSVRRSFFCEGWLYGSIYEYLEDHINNMCGKISSECIIPLTKRAKDIVCDMIENCWEWLGDDE